jgi:ABC-type spermidine/putrescine transport system permease subunit I
MVGNALQTLVLVQRDLPRGAALTVLLIALLLVTVLLGLRGSGSDELPLP